MTITNKKNIKISRESKNLGKNGNFFFLRSQENILVLFFLGFTEFYNFRNHISTIPRNDKKTEFTRDELR